MEQALLAEDNTYKIPAWNMLRREYDSRWEEEKEKPLEVILDQGQAFLQKDTKHGLKRKVQTGIS